MFRNAIEVMFSRPATKKGQRAEGGPGRLEEGQGAPGSLLQKEGGAAAGEGERPRAGGSRRSFRSLLRVFQLRVRFF